MKKQTKRVLTNNILNSGFFELKKAVTVYKRVALYDAHAPAIATLEIPRGATVYLTDHKCRASSAIVKEITSWNGKQVKTAYSKYSSHFKYEVGQKVKPLKKFSYKHNECESGIHFFRTKKEARNYNF